MKTLFLTQDFAPDPGGIARLYGELCGRFPAGSVEVSTVASAERAGGTPLPPGVVIRRMPFSFRDSRHLTSVLRWLRWTRRRLRAGDIDLIQVGNIRPTGYIAAHLQPRTGTPYVLYVHGRDVWKEARKRQGPGPGRWTLRKILGRAAAVIANSHATAEHTKRLYSSLGLPEDGRVRVVHPGTDPARFVGLDRSIWRTKLGLHADQPVLLTVGRLVRRKGIDTMLAALPALTARHPTLMYLVAGAGRDMARLERLADELRVRRSVRFLGPVSDDELPQLYAAADVFVMVAREELESDEVEGFGIVYCEAAAAGVPVVAGASGGVAEAVREGETALLVPPTDVDAVAHAIDTLLSDAELRARMGRAGRHAVETYYHWDRAAAEAWRILEEVARR